MFCPSCHKQLPDNSKFCTGCGAPIAPDAPTAPAAPFHRPKAPTIDSHPPVYSGDKIAAPTAATAPVEKKSQKHLVALILVIVLVSALMAVIVAFGIMFFSDLSADDRSDRPALTLPDFEKEKEEDPFADVQTPVDGNPIPEGNPYRDCYNSTTGFVLADSHKKYYARGDLVNLNDQELEIAVQEIYARRGQSFQDSYLQEYFDSMGWYAAKTSAVTLNSYEQANLALLDIYRRDLDGTLYRSGNPYLSFQNGSNAYYISGSDSRYLNANDLQHLNKVQLTLARNEIFARRGYVFTDVQLQEYFYCKQWYRPSDTFNQSNMSDWEVSNIELIQVYEKILDGGYTPSSGNSYTPYYSYYNEYILPEGSSRELNEYDLYGYSLEELCIARNQIIARHGYTFKDDELMEYFLLCSWYTPSTAPGRNDLVSLSSVEAKNMNFIADYEKKLKNKPNLGSLDTSMSYSYTTDYFGLTLPAYWKNYCTIRKSGDLYSNEGFTVSFSENKSYGGSQGHLFTILLLPTSQEYSYYPSYDYMGTITDGSEATWNVIILYPTDVQFDEVYVDLYNKMYNEVSSILYTLSPRNGYYYV